jgi:hypothetical protein
MVGVLLEVEFLLSSVDASRVAHPGQIAGIDPAEAVGTSPAAAPTVDPDPIDRR